LTLSIVDPGKTRSLISETGGELRVEIPTKKNVFLILFLAAWLVGWVISELAVPLSFSNKGKDVAFLIFAVVWLIGWTVAGIFTMYAWFWLVIGKELMSPMGYNPGDYRWAMQVWGVSGGVLAFDYGAKMYHFAIGVGAAEANEILKKILSRFLGLASKD